MPAKNYLPETIEEKLICYADKFYSKSRPAVSLSVQQVYEGLLRFGTDGANRFMEWHRMFAL